MGTISRIFDGCFRAMMAILAVVAAASSVTAEDVEPAIDFAHEVVPILKEHCVECHGGHRHEGDFSINTREAFVDSSSAVPGDAAHPI